jgi:signal transduction histidine kinase
VSRTAAGRTAAALPWIAPNTDALLRLAEAPAALARPSADAALLALLLRAAPFESVFCESALAAPALADGVAALLKLEHRPWVPPQCEVAGRVRALVARAVPLARRIASTERAAVLAALAPLGWLAVAAVDHEAADAALASPDRTEELWGLDASAIARRLAFRWKLPDWAATALGSFDLPLPAAREVVRDVPLFVAVQLALHETERRGFGLGLTKSADRAELLAALNLTESALDELWREPAEGEADVAANPFAEALLPHLLRMAADSRRKNGAALVARLEQRGDELHRALAKLDATASESARAAKLVALAELAAGAGHEINNPLAVISMNAQRLARTEPDPARGEALHTIVRQVNRISGILRDLMQFARPSAASPQSACAHELAQAVRAELDPLATERGVRLEVREVPCAFVRCDAAQIRHALAALVRNAVEAAGRDGWARVSCVEADDSIAFVVEDGGPGLSAEAREHAFDPFFSGRSAGRGRGLGLPTAWRYARQNGGDLRHDECATATRFVLTVPRAMTLEFPDRQSA